MFNGNDITIDVNVDSIELLGSEKILHFSIGENNCCAKIDANIEIGQTLKLNISNDDLYYFDKKTGVRI